MSVKIHHPFQTRIRIDGKQYNYLTYEDTKADAQRRAKQYREIHKGVGVRVLREKSKTTGRVHYSVWTRR